MIASTDTHVEIFVFLRFCSAPCCDDNPTFGGPIRSVDFFVYNFGWAKFSARSARRRPLPCRCGARAVTDARLQAGAGRTMMASKMDPLAAKECANCCEPGGRAIPKDCARRARRVLWQELPDRALGRSATRSSAFPLLYVSRMRRRRRKRLNYGMRMVIIAASAGKCCRPQPQPCYRARTDFTSSVWGEPCCGLSRSRALLPGMPRPASAPGGIS